MKDLFTTLTKKSDYYGKKNITIKFNLNEELRLNKTKEIPSMIIVVRVVFHGNNKYQSKIFLDESLYKLLT